MFDRYTRDLSPLRAELDAFGGLLQSGSPLGETKQILPFVRRSRHLAAAFGFANHALGAPDLLAMERPLFGSFRCDVAIGSSTARQFTLIELEDARENSVFEAVKGRDFPRWSSRFERGFSQLVDWAWRIDYEPQPSAALGAAFGTSDPGSTICWCLDATSGSVRGEERGWTGAICTMGSRASGPRSGHMTTCSRSSATGSRQPNKTRQTWSKAILGGGPIRQLQKPNKDQGKAGLYNQRATAARVVNGTMNVVCGRCYTRAEPETDISG